MNNFIALVLDPASFRAGTGAAAAEVKQSGDGDGAEKSLSEVPTEALEAELRRRSAASAPEGGRPQGKEVPVTVGHHGGVVEGEPRPKLKDSMGERPNHSNHTKISKMFVKFC